MDLIHEKDRLLSVHADRILRIFHDLFHIFFSGDRGVDLLKTRTRRMRDHLCERRLSCSGRSVKDHRSQLVRLDRTVKEFILSDNMFLTDHLVQSRRAHSGREGRFLLHRILSHIIK